MEESVFISDNDTAKLDIQFFRPLALCAVSIKVMNNTLSGHLQELKTKEKV